MAAPGSSGFFNSYVSPNNSEEEIATLEKQMANISIGLNRHQIQEKLLVRRWRENLKRVQGAEPESCNFCMKPYLDGEEIGLLDCGHFFHSNCIYQFLTQKNICPICKGRGLRESEN